MEAIINGIHKLLTGADVPVGGYDAAVPCVGNFEGWHCGVGVRYAIADIPQSYYPLIAIAPISESGKRYERNGSYVASVEAAMFVKAINKNSDIVGDNSTTQAWVDFEALLLSNTGLDGAALRLLSSDVRYGQSIETATGTLDKHIVTIGLQYDVLSMIK